MHKGMLAWVGLLIAVMMAVPALTVGVDPSPESGSETSKKAADGKSPQPVVKVYLTEEKRVVKLPLETYIRGVVAAEMPHDFHPEALKAQALAARTYIVDRLKRGDFSDMEDMGAAAKGAHVTDTVRHQAYIRDERLKKDWGKQYEANSRRIRDAVAATRGKVILYDGEPIYAAFFSTSNGRTENSEAYFSQAYPYLRSVPSPWDRESPKFQDTRTLSIQEFIRRLEEATGKQVAISAATGNGWMKLVKKTEGDRIETIKVGEQTFTGRQVRESLALASSDFSWKIHGGKITLTTRGYGHGVGMSQWGANLMAWRGKIWKEIIQHYYKGVDIGDVTDVLDRNP